MLLRKCVLLVLAILVVGCVSTPPFEEPDGPPRENYEHIIEKTDAIPKNLLPSRYGNQATYFVNGKEYTTLASADNYREVGMASWYGSKFHGRKTSSGEVYSMYKMTAAHKSLPLPTFVKVTHLENNKSVVVKVNDRGPFHGDRIIDLSYAAAKKLDMLKAGTARVEVVTLTAGEPLVDHHGEFYLQVGAFSKLDAAQDILQKVNMVLQKGSFIDSTNNKGLHRVRIGPIYSLAEARNIKSALESEANIKARVLSEKEL
ncbi:MAG: septal ring lytic transglycosylase RlpA family protein [Pseudomonadota bacterium]